MSQAHSRDIDTIHAKIAADLANQGGAETRFGALNLLKASSQAGAGLKTA